MHATPNPDAVAETSGSWMRGVLARAEATVAHPLLAYGGILVLQLRVIWNVWQYKDLTSGDTAGYFTYAVSWTNGLHDDIVWSPLYTNFFGTVDALFSDVYAAAMVHRIAIVLAAALLVLALMRSLLGPAMGLLVTVWWVVLSPNFNVEYEVHLFGLLPILVAALVVARNPGRGALGIALAVLAGTTLLLRNEMAIATAIVAVAIAVREVRERRAHQVPILAYARAYGVPLVIVCLLVGGAYWRSFDQGHYAQLSFRAKHELNMCQVYTFNYQQRYPSRVPGNPFTACAPVMQHDFGRPMPSLLQMTTANPRAVAGFVAWNTRLLPSGLQVALFGATVTGDNPDYFAVEKHRTYALVLSIIGVMGIIVGLVAIRSDREFWRREWLPPRVWALIVLGSVAITTLVVALTQRPRPEYMYGLTVGLLALTGVCVLALLRRVGGAHLLAALAAGLTLVLVVALPSYYHRGPRPIHDGVQRLQVIRESLRQPSSVLVTSAYGYEICAYLAETHLRHCTSPDWAALRAQVTGGRPLRDVLDQAKVTAIYADPLLQADPAIAQLLASPRSEGWRRVAAGTAADGSWSVLIRAS